MSLFNPIIYAIIGGLLPALIWLLFWLREDKKQPEPVRLLLAAFLAGGFSVFLVLPLQKLALDIFASTAMVLVLWALIEETAKLLAAYFTAFKSKAFNEPIDALIYLISAALGFSAMENILFLIAPFADGTVTLALLTGNIRFIGASLLHVVASASVGAGLAFSWYKKREIKELDLILGLFVAITLHSLFNFFIINIKGAGIFISFTFVWISVIILLALFEAVKRIRRPKIIKDNY